MITYNSDSYDKYGYLVNETNEINSCMHWDYDSNCARNYLLSLKDACYKYHKCIVDMIDKVDRVFIDEYFHPQNLIWHYINGYIDPDHITMFEVLYKDGTKKAYYVNYYPEYKDPTKINQYMNQLDEFIVELTALITV